MLRIKETLREAFGDRFFGFLMMAIMPNLVILANGIESGFYSFAFLLMAFNTLLWLTVIRFTL